jgi:hypothetical protein
MALTRIRAQQISNIDYKQAVRVVTTANITLSGGAPSSVDGVSLSTNSRVLVNGQSTQTQNGLYLVQTVGSGSNGTWVRTTDTDATGEMQAGMVVTVTEGNTYRDTLWTLTTNDPIVLGSSNITFQQSTSFNFGNITANGTAILANTVGDSVTFTAGNNVAITGNATAKTVTIGVTGIQSTSISNGSSNVAIGSANANVTVSVAGTANVVVVSANLVGVTGNITASGNVTGNYFFGNGSQLSGIVTSVSNINNGTSNVAIGSANANVTVGVNGTGNVAVFADSGVTVAGNILPTANVTYSLGSTTQRWKDLWVANSTIYLGETPLTTTGNTLLVNGLSVITSANNSSLSLTGNVQGGNLLTGGLISASGAITGASVVGGVITGTSVSVSGNVTGSFFIGNGSALTGVVATSIGTLPSLSVTGNANVGNVNTVGLISATGNIFGSFYNGNGSALTGVVATSIGTLPSLSVTGNANVGNVNTVGLISATGNVSGGNIRTVGLISATGNVLGGNILTAGVVTATGNVLGGNITTVGLISATSTITSAANIIGGNVNTVGLISATGNVSGGNIRTAGVVTATGNVLGGNILTAGVVTATGNITTIGNINTAFGISTSGNIVFPAVANIGLVGSLSATPYSANMTSVASVTTTLPSTNYSTFTVEYWINPIATPVSGNYLWWIGDKGGSAGQIGILVNNPGPALYLYGGPSPISLTPIITVAGLGTSTWTHMAIVKTGGNFYCYVNGTLTLGPLGAATQSFANFSITTPGSSVYMSNFRITNTAVYTGNFTVPVVPLTAIPGTQLLTLQSATIVDNSPLSLSLSSSGTTMVTTPQPFGAGTPGANFLFDGSGSWVSSGNLIPTANITYNLGSSTNRWNTIHGNTASITGNITSGNLLLSGAIEDSGQLDIRTTASNGNIVLTPNGTGNVNTGANISVTGLVTAASVVGGIITGSSVSVTGNVAANNLSAGNVVVVGGFTIKADGTKLMFSYGGANIFSLSSTGNVIASNNITAFGTP